MIAHSFVNTPPYSFFVNATKKKDESLHPFLTNQTYFYEKKLNFYLLLPDTNIVQALVNASESTLKNFKSSHTTFEVNLESVFV